MGPERPPETAAVRKEPYAEQREADQSLDPNLRTLAEELEGTAARLRTLLWTGRGVSIAITHLQEAAMWLNRAHYKKD